MFTLYRNQMLHKIVFYVILRRKKMLRAIFQWRANWLVHWSVQTNKTFYRVSTSNARYWYRNYVRPSVCPSVRPSVTIWYCIETA